MCRPLMSKTSSETEELHEEPWEKYHEMEHEEIERRKEACELSVAYLAIKSQDIISDQIPEDETSKA